MSDHTMAKCLEITDHLMAQRVNFKKDVTDDLFNYEL